MFTLFYFLFRLPRPLKILARLAFAALVIMSFVHAYQVLHNNMKEPQHVHTRRSTR